MSPTLARAPARGERRRDRLRQWRVASRAPLIVAGAAVAALAGASPAPAPPPSIRVLVFTKTAAFRHTSIPVAISTFRELGTRNALAVDATEDAAAFTDAGLARYDVVAFVLTTGDVLDGAQQAALQRFVRAGGGFVGVHSASDTEHDWPWYGGLVGAFFRAHPAIQSAAVDIARVRDLSTARLPPRWVRTDEWYAFTSPPRDVGVLATLDETSYAPGDAGMGGNHPIAWSHAYDGGRAWYTALGHTEASYAEPLFRAHLLGGILYAAGFDAPRIDSLAVKVRDGRVSVAVRHSRCRACRAELRAGGRVTPLSESVTAARGTSGRLAPGRRRVTVTLVEPTSGLRASAARVVRV
jgi:type 1 glutamine amidotransferase